MAEIKEQEKTKVTVLPGRVVQCNKKVIPPGEHFYCDKAEARRLCKGGHVKFADNQDPLSSEELLQAIASIDPDKTNEEVWTRSGLPQVSALSEIIGKAVSATERSTAYEIYLAQDVGKAEK